MSHALLLSILTPEQVVFEGEVQYLSVPGTAGYMGILVDHAPIISSLKPGAFEVRLPSGDKTLHFVTQQPGFLEVSQNKVSILLDAADSSVLLRP